MLFTHDTEMSLGSAAALANTGRERSGDQLTTVTQLRRFVTEWGWSGIFRWDSQELAQVQALRPRLERLWCNDESEVVDEVNALLRECLALPQLVQHDGYDWHIHGTGSDAPLAHRMAVEAALAVADVLRLGELERLRVCAADDCRDLMVDLSKNRSRRFCDTTCANRTNVAAFRARRAASPTTARS